MVSMELRELLQALVETEDKMERMAIVEANPDLMGTPEAGEDKPNEYQGMYEAEKAAHETLKQKYITTFFSGGKVEEKEEPKEPDESGKTLDDLFPNV
jgi:hypothetical protein